MVAIVPPMTRHKDGPRRIAGLVPVSALAQVAGLLLLIAAPAQAGEDRASHTIQAAAVTVIDGDTIALGARTFHLAGVDAPEPGQVCTVKGRSYDCGMVSRTALMDLTAGAAVTCTPLDEAGTSADPVTEGQPARCLADGYDLAEGMAYTGWALADRATTTRYVRLENDARKAGRGLWRGRFVAPWRWRAGARIDPAGTVQ